MAYLGRAPNTGVRTRFIFTATASQTTFSGADDNGVTLKYEDAAYVDVFLNGVLLIPVTDYAATTKTSVVLTSGAAVSDIVEIVAYDIANIADTVSKADGGTFDGDVTFNGAFTSQGIDDNATSTAMTLDSSGNVLVGKTSATFNDTAGIAQFSNGTFYVTRNAGNAFYINRSGSDGNIIQFYKGYTNQVGSIGTFSGDIAIGNDDIGLHFNASGNNILPANLTTSSWTDGTANLGGGSQRFNNMFLAGGVYLGGTGSANYLNDYEYGFFEPSLLGSVSNPTITWDTVVGQEGYYVKVGRMVHIQINFRTDAVSGGSGNLYVGNLPFTSPSVSSQGGMASFAVARAQDWGSNTPSAAYINEGTNYIVLEYRTSANGGSSTLQVSDMSTIGNRNMICISGTYYTTD